MPLKILILITMMVAFAITVSQFIGWRFPLATTSAHGLNPILAIVIVIATEIAWFTTNVFAIVTVRKAWKNPPNFMCKLVAFAITLSLPSQVFLGHLAIRDLLAFMHDIPSSW